MPGKRTAWPTKPAAHSSPTRTVRAALYDALLELERKERAPRAGRAVARSQLTRLTRRGMAVRGTATDHAKWELSPDRYLTGQIDRATHRSILMHQLRPNLKLGVEWIPA